MVYHDNSAGRLHRVLTALNGKRADAPLADSWAAVLGVRDGDTYGLLRGIVTVVELAGKAEQHVRDVVDDEEHQGVLTRWIGPVQTSLGRAFFPGSTADVTGGLKPEVMLSLESAAMELHRRNADGELDLEKGSEAQSLVRELLGELQEDTELDPETRARLIRHAAALQHALQLAWIVGVDGVSDALDGAVGAVLQEGHQRPDVQNAPTFKRTLQVLGVVGQLVVVANGVAELGGTVGPIIQALIGAN